MSDANMSTTPNAAEAGQPTPQELAARLDALSKQMETLRDDLETERQERKELEAAVKQKDSRIDELQAEVAELDERTDLLSVVENSDDMDGQQRSATLLQHLHRAAKAREKRGEPPAATVNRDEAEEALHFPDIHRTAFYPDMRRAARLVGDEDVCWYHDGELTLDLRGGDVPTSITNGKGGESL